MKKLLTLALGLPLAAQAQAPTLTATTPARHTASAPRTGPLGFTFSQPVTGAAGLRLTGSKLAGRLAGTAGGDGTATLSFRPQRAFAPGELIRATVPASVQAVAGGTALAAGQALEFRAAAGPGTGAFTAGQQVYVNSSGIKSPLLVDVNNDGRLDLLYADDQINNDVFLCLGNGQGTFAARVGIGTGLEATSLAVGDFNEDGNLDVAVTGYAAGYRMRVLLGNGQGSFSQQAAAQVTVPAIPLYPRVGDVNADGHDDIVFLDLGPFSVPNNPMHTTLHVRLGDGQGNFTNAPDVPMPLPASDNNATGLHLTDLNNDGYLDVLMSAVSTNQAIGLGDGRGGFTLTTTAPTTPVMALAELTGDGVPDVVCATTGTTLSVYAGNGQGGFGPTAVATLPGPAALNNVSRLSAHAADLDGDGDLDLLTAETGFHPVTSALVAAVRLWLNDGAGNFTFSASQAGMAGEMASGDVNNDGALDVAVAYRYGGSMGPFIGISLNTALPTAPTLSSFTPATGGAGTLVTLTGTNFTGATAVLVGGVPVAGFTVVSGTSITLTLPAGSTGGLVSVITPTGTATSAGSLTVLQAPTLTALAPATGLAGSTVVLTGTNLTGATAVSFNGTAATTFTVTSATSITVTVPAGASSGPITVTTPNGTASSSTFTMLQAPTITALAPTAVLAGGTVTISGTNLAGATALTLGGTPITGFTVTAAGTITFTLPAGSTSGVVTVTTPGGTATSATALTVLQAPTITSFTPGSAPANTPVTVTVTGSNLTGATAVTVGGVAVTNFTVSASGALTFTLPAGAAGGLIAITTPGGTATSATALTIVLGTRPAAELAVQLFPNPARATVYVRRAAGSTAPLHVECYNALGQRVHTAVLPASAPMLDVSGLAAGVYTLRLTAGAAGATHRLVLE